MPIQYVSGDLFVNRFNVQAFAHGCNCRGSMGAGIAVGFKARYPEMFQQYHQMCKADPREFNPGDVFLWISDTDLPHVFNLGTQERPGGRATYKAIEATFTTVHTEADQAEITSIAMPRIGAGYGQLDWEKIKVIIERVFADWPGDLIVYEEYVPE